MNRNTTHYRRCHRLAARRLTVPIVLLFGLIGSTAGVSSTDYEAIDIYHPPGQRVDIGGYALHIHCLGEGTPTVVFDSGVGGFSLEWSTIQEKLSQYSRTCSYDRAGYGWSDRSPYPRTTNTITNELHRLLDRAAIPGPYVLVGHSFGGYTIRYFANKYPQEVNGLVLIDASHPEQFAHFPKPPERKNRKPLPNRSSVTHIVRSAYPHNYPADIRHLAYMLMLRRHSAQIQLAELERLRESARQLSARAGTLRDIPVTVLTRGRRVWPDNNYGDAMERVWSFLQRDFLSLTPRARQTVARHSGHAIHLDQPQLVVKQVLKSLRNARWYAARSNLVSGAHAEKEPPQLRSKYVNTSSSLVNVPYRD